MKNNLIEFDFAAEGRKRMLEDSQPLNGRGIFLAFSGSIMFWAVVIGLGLALFERACK